MGREEKCIPSLAGCAGATQGVLRHSRALSRGTCCCVAGGGARVPEVFALQRSHRLLHAGEYLIASSLGLSPSRANQRTARLSFPLPVLLLAAVFEFRSRHVVTDHYVHLIFPAGRTLVVAADVVLV